MSYSLSLVVSADRDPSTPAFPFSTSPYISDELKPVAMLGSTPSPTPTAPTATTDATAAMDYDQHPSPVAPAAVSGLASPVPITVAAATAPEPAATAVGGPSAAAVLLCDPRERVLHTEVCFCCRSGVYVVYVCVYVRVRGLYTCYLFFSSVMILL
jgi:hypothetical protein